MNFRACEVHAIQAERNLRDSRYLNGDTGVVPIRCRWYNEHQFVSDYQLPAALKRLDLKINTLLNYLD